MPPSTRGSGVPGPPGPVCASMVRDVVRGDRGPDRRSRSGRSAPLRGHAVSWPIQSYSEPVGHSAL